MASDEEVFVGELVDLLDRHGFTTLLPDEVSLMDDGRCPDLFAGRDGRLYVFVVMTGEHPTDISSPIVDGLRHVAVEFGGKPRVAVRKLGTDWKFLYIDELREREETYRLPERNTGAYGQSIDEL